MHVWYFNYYTSINCLFFACNSFLFHTLFGWICLGIFAHSWIFNWKPLWCVNSSVNRLTSQFLFRFIPSRNLSFHCSDMLFHQHSSTIIYIMTFHKLDENIYLQLIFVYSAVCSFSLFPFLFFHSHSTSSASLIRFTEMCCVETYQMSNLFTIDCIVFSFTFLWRDKSKFSTENTFSIDCITSQNLLFIMLT